MPRDCFTVELRGETHTERWHRGTFTVLKHGELAVAGEMDEEPTAAVYAPGHWLIVRVWDCCEEER